MLPFTIIKPLANLYFTFLEESPACVPLTALVVPILHLSQTRKKIAKILG